MGSCYDKALFTSTFLDGNLYLVQETIIMKLNSTAKAPSSSNYTPHLKI